ncbi:MAG: hopanoid-associated sugar epimerase [Armatimonadota bacterium]
MRALVTGGTGFIGNRVVRTLLEQGVEVRALVRPKSDRRHLERLPVEFRVGTLNDPASLADAVKGADLLFHVAADYRFWVPDPSRMHQTNVEGTVALLRAAWSAGVSRMVYTSSTVTVRSAPEEPGTETSFVKPPECRSAYQLTKVIAEREVRRLAREGAPVVIVNPSTPIGPGDRRPTPTGRLVVDFLNRRLPAFLDAALNWVAVDDVALGHWLAASRGRIGERYILGHANLSIEQFLMMLAEVSGLPAPRVKIPYFAAYSAGAMGDVWSRISGRASAASRDGVRMARVPMQFDCGKAIRELGLPQTPIPTAIADAVAWFRAEGLAPPKEVR